MERFLNKQAGGYFKNIVLEADVSGNLVNTECVTCGNSQAHPTQSLFFLFFHKPGRRSNLPGLLKNTVMKVICINAPDIKECMKYGIEPLQDGATYTIRQVVEQARGTGYLLQEIHNYYCVIKNNPGLEVSYHSSRFIPLSEIDETEIVRENILVNH